MKTKSFYDIIEKRLTKEQIAAIERQAQLEVESLRASQQVPTDGTTTLAD